MKTAKKVENDMFAAPLEEIEKIKKRFKKSGRKHDYQNHGVKPKVFDDLVAALDDELKDVPACEGQLV